MHCPASVSVSLPLFLAEARHRDGTAAGGQAGEQAAAPPANRGRIGVAASLQQNGDARRKHAVGAAHDDKDDEMTVNFIVAISLVDG